MIAHLNAAETAVAAATAMPAWCVGWTGVEGCWGVGGMGRHL